MQGDVPRDVAVGSRTEAEGSVRLRLSPRRPGESTRNALKRTIDVLLSLVLLIVVAPALLAIAAAIKLDSRGPVIFVQERAGSVRVAHRDRVWWEPRTFNCYKFRTMVSTADEAAHRAYISRFVRGEVDDAAGTFKLTGDARITRVGRVLRRTSLDELPQLVNVLRGDMSMVGPRPVPLYEVAEYEPWHFERLAARPGITGLWQVHGRGRVGFLEMMEMDLAYVRRPSLRTDLKLLAATLPAVFTGKGAH